MNKVKLSLLTLLMCLSFNSFSQRKSTDLISNRIGTVKWNFKQMTDLSSNDTTYYLWGGFQNYKYSTITDIKSVFMSSQSQLDELISDLKMVYSEMDKKQSISWDKKLYILKLVNYTDEMYLGDPDGRGYTYLTKRQVEKTIEFLESIKFPK